MTVFSRDIGYSAWAQESWTLPKGATMSGTILVYGNESMLVTTRGLILEEAGFEVYTTTGFAGAMLTLMTQPLDVLLLCESLSDEERRGILETAFAIQPNIRCATFGADGREIRLAGANAIETLDGPSILVEAVGRILQPASSPILN